MYRAMYTNRVLKKQLHAGKKSAWKKYRDLYLGQPPAEEIAVPETVKYPARTIDAKTTA
jgi:hypothetical protein